MTEYESERDEVLNGLHILSYQCKHRDDCGTCTICYTAIPAAEAAVKKVTKIKPIFRNRTRRCPSCEEVVFFADNHCIHCGQALDWEAVDWETES